MREQFWLYPLISAVGMMAIAHPSGLGMFPLVAMVAPLLILVNIAFVIYIARRHRPKLAGVTLTSGLFILTAYAIIQSTLNF